MSGVGQAIPAAVIDSSALMSILLGEAAASLFMTGFQATDKLYIGAATRGETWLVAFNAKGLAGAQLVEALLLALQRWRRWTSRRAYCPSSSTALK